MFQMEDGDLLSFAAQQQEAWDERTTSDRASTDSDVPSFAKPPHLEQQESVNLLDFGESEGISTEVEAEVEAEASVHLMQSGTANESDVNHVDNSVDLLAAQLPENESVDLFAIAPPDPFAPAVVPDTATYSDVFAEMAVTARNMQAEAELMHSKPLLSSPPSKTKKMSVVEGSPQQGQSAESVLSQSIRESEDVTSMVKSLDTNNSLSTKDAQSVMLDHTSNDSTTQALPVQGAEQVLEKLADAIQATKERLSEPHASLQARPEPISVVDESPQQKHTIDAVTRHAGEPEENSSIVDPLDMKDDITSKDVQTVMVKNISKDSAETTLTETEAKQRPDLVVNTIEPKVKMASQSIATKVLPNPESTNGTAPEIFASCQKQIEAASVESYVAMQESTDSEKINGEQTTPNSSLLVTASSSPEAAVAGKEISLASPPQVPPQPRSSDTSSPPHSQDKKSPSTLKELPMSPTMVGIPSEPIEQLKQEKNPTTSPVINGKKSLTGTVVTSKSMKQQTHDQYAKTEENLKSKKNLDTSGKSVDAQYSQEKSRSPTTDPLPSDTSKEDSNHALLDRVQALERQLTNAQSTIRRLEENHANDKKDAAVQDSLLVDLQTNLQTQMSQRAEAEDNARRAAMMANALKQKLVTLEAESQNKMEQLEKTLAKVTTSKAEMEKEFEIMREERDEKARKEASMALQLNAATKIVAEKANAAEYYENQADDLKKELEIAKALLSTTTQERDHLKEEVMEWKDYAEKRSKQLEAALAKEQKRNEERKRKMKGFVEAKTEEVRVVKADNLGLQTEMDQTNMTLKDLNQRYKQLHAQWVESQTRNRELQRDVTKVMKDSEKMSKVGGTLEAKLSRSAMESEDHKNKRLAAKNELMAVLRQLEAERDVNNRLRDRIKMTFTPKVLSQQQSMQELLDRLEDTMLKVATKLGRPLPPFTAANESEQTNQSMDGPSIPGESMMAVSEVNTQRVLSRLEMETKRVSKCIDSMNGSVRRLNSLVEAPSTRGCVDVFSAMLMTTPTPTTS